MTHSALICIICMFVKIELTGLCNRDIVVTQYGKRYWYHKLIATCYWFTNHWNQAVIHTCTSRGWSTFRALHLVYIAESIADQTSRILWHLRNSTCSFDVIVLFKSIFRKVLLSELEVPDFEQSPTQYEVVTQHAK